MSERVSFSALRDTLNNSEYEEQPVLSNSADATLRRQEKEIQRLKKANFNLKLQVFHLEEKLGLLPNDFEGDATNKSTLSMEDSGLQSPKANLLQVLEEKEREVAQRDELLKKARKVIFSLQEKIKELYERNKSLHDVPNESHGEKNNKHNHKLEERWPSSLSETFQVFQKRWNHLADNFPGDVARIPKEAVVSHDWNALENVFHHVIQSLPLFQKLLRNSDSFQSPSRGSSCDYQRSPKFVREHKADYKSSGRGVNNEPSSPLEIDVKAANSYWRSPEKPQSNQSTPTRQRLDLDSGQMRRLQEVLMRFAEIPVLQLPQISIRSNDEVVRYVTTVYEQTSKLERKISRYQEEIDEKEAELQDALVAKAQVEDSITALQEERERLVQKVERLENQLEDTVDHYRSENEKLSEELQRTKEELDETQSSYETELNRLTQELEQRREEYESEIAQLSEELEKTREELDAAQSSYESELNEKTQELEQRREEYEREIAQLSEKFEKTKEELDAAQSSYESELNEKTQELEQRREEYETEIAQLSEQLEKTQSDLQESQEYYMQIIDQKTNELSQLKENYETQIACLSEELERRTKELEEKEEDYETKIERLSEELEHLNHQFEETERRYQQESEQLSRELELKAKKLQELEQGNEEETSRLSQKLEEVQRELEKLQEEQRYERAHHSEELEKHLLELDETKKEYEMEITRLAEEIQQMKNERAEIEDTYREELNQQIAKMEEMREKYEDEVSQLSEQLKETERRFQESTSHYQEENGRLLEQLQQVSSELEKESAKAEQNETLSRMVEEYEEWLKVLQADSEHRYQRGQPVYCVLRQTLLSEIDEQNNKLGEYESLLEKLKQDYELLLKEKTYLNSSNQDNEEENKIYREQIEMIQKEKEQLELNKEELQFQNASLKQQAQLIAKELEKCRNDLNSSKEELKKLNLKISEDAAVAENLRKEKESAESELACLKEERDKLKRERDTDKEQIESLNGKISQLQSDLTSLEWSHRTKQGELENILHEKEQLWKQVEKLQSELETARSKCENQNESLAEMQLILSEKEASIESMRSDLAYKETQLDILNKELEESSLEHETLQQRVVELESKLSDTSNQLQTALQKKSASPTDFDNVPDKESTAKNAEMSKQPNLSSNVNYDRAQGTSDQNNIGNGLATADQQSENDRSEESSASPEKAELEQLLRQRDYENLVLQQEAESYYEEWKKMENESELLRSMLHTLEDEQLEIRKYVLELKDAIEAIFQKASPELSYVQQSLRPYFNRLLEEVSKDSPNITQANNEYLGNSNFQNIGESPKERKAASLLLTEDECSESKDLDDTCHQVFSQFSSELQNLQSTMQQLAENIPYRTEVESETIRCSEQLPNMVISGHSIEFEELRSYIQQLTRQLAGFRNVALAAKRALLSEITVQNISVYEMSQPAFGQPTATNSSPWEAHYSEGSSRHMDAAEGRLKEDELKAIAEVSSTVLTAKTYMMKGIEKLDTHVESVLQSLAKRLSLLSEKQRTLSKKLKHHRQLPNMSFMQNVTGENPLSLHKDSLSYKTAEHTWEDVALKQIEETQRLINTAHQRLAWEKARLIQSVFGQVPQ